MILFDQSIGLNAVIWMRATALSHLSERQSLQLLAATQTLENQPTTNSTITVAVDYCQSVSAPTNTTAEMTQLCCTGIVLVLLVVFDTVQVRLLTVNIIYLFIYSVP